MKIKEVWMQYGDEAFRFHIQPVFNIVDIKVNRLTLDKVEEIKKSIKENYHTNDTDKKK